MIRVLSLHARMPFGGAERVIETVARGLSGERFSFSFATLYDEGPVGALLREAGYPVTAHLAKVRLDPAIYLRLRRLVRQQKPDVLHVTDSTLPLFWAGALRRLRHGPPLVIGVHSMGHYEGSRRSWLSKKMALPVASTIICLSETHKDYVVRNDGARPDRVSIVPVGVDISRFAPPGAKEAARAAAGFDPDALHVGIVGALRSEKNHEMFLRVARSVLGAHPGVCFHVAGDGTRMEYLRRLCADLGLGASVTFHGAVRDVAPMVAAFDIQLLTSDLEAFPQVLLEAMACAVPVCATDVGCVRDMVEHGVNGFVSPRGDVETMAAHVTKLLADQKLRVQMGAAGRRVVEQRYTREIMIAGYGQVLDEAAAPRSRRGGR
ncbi:MAG: glycosyl transferase [Fimbriimonadales bacterium]